MTTIQKLFENFRASMADNGRSQLPPIPEGFVRLSHFTGGKAALSAMREGFRFRGGMMIGTTTDSFSDNKELIDLLSSGKTGAFTREGFGDHVVLLDLTFQEHKNLSSMNFRVEDKTIPPERIVGIVKRVGSNWAFTSNEGYNPRAQIKIEKISREMPVHNREVSQQPQPGENKQPLDVF